MTTNEKIAIDKAPSIEQHMLKRDRWISILSISLIIAAWIFVTEMKWVEPLFLPSAKNLWTAWLSILPKLPGDIFDSVIRRILPGFVIGSSIGTVLGISMAMNRISRALFNPIVEVLRPLPPLALIPLLILWLGIGFSTQIVLIAFGSFIIMVVTSYEAVRNVSPIYIHAATMLGANPRQIFQKVILPAIIPDISGGIRVSVAASFGYDVAAELMGAMSGIGYRLVLARRYLLTENIIVILVVIAFLSFSLDFLVRRVNARVTQWKSRIEEK